MTLQKMWKLSALGQPSTRVYRALCLLAFALSASSVPGLWHHACDEHSGSSLFSGDASLQSRRDDLLSLYAVTFLCLFVWLILLFVM